MKYPIISSPEADRTYDIHSIPHKVLIDVKGRVVEEGHIGLGGNTLDPLLKDAEVMPEGDYSKKFDPIKRMISLGQWGNAWAACQGLEKDKTDGDNAKKLREWIEERGKKAIADGEEAQTAGNWFDAIEAYQDVEKRWKGDVQKDAKTKLDGVKKDKDGKKALDAKKFWDGAKDAESKKDKATAAALYLKASKILGKGSKLGDEAEAKAKALQ